MTKEHRDTPPAVTIKQPKPWQKPHVEVIPVASSELNPGNGAEGTGHS